MRFESAKSPRMTILMYVLILIAVAVAVLYCLYFENVLRFVVAALCLAVVGMVIWVRMTTWYELRAASLYLHAGPFTDRIPYGDIQTVDKTRGWNFIMALDTDRLEINAGINPEKGRIVLSPENEDAFLEELKKHCPDMQIRG